jgi:NTP pyrophosphatase (non-canonical NTP hydrolase)
MKVREYEDFVMASAKVGIDHLEYNFIGLAGETGECMEWLKKAVYRKDSKFTEEDLKLELGDVIHYVTRICLYYGWDLKDVMEANMTKLKARKSKEVVA